MAISLEEFARLDLKDLLGSALHACTVCGVPLQESCTGNRKGPEGRVCSDCYFEALGKAVEEHPIGAPRVRAG